MLSKLRTRLTFANVVSVIALFVALGGSSYAAIKVTGKNVKDSSLTGKDVKNSSLTTSDVKNGSLLSRDFKSGQLPAGPKGDTGATGPKGADGAAGTARAYAHVSAAGVLDPAKSKNFTAVRKLTSIGAGAYCLTPAAGLDRDALPSVVSVDWNGSSGGSTSPAAHSHPGYNCAAGEFEVITSSSAGRTDQPFTIIVP